MIHMWGEEYEQHAVNNMPVSALVYYDTLIVYRYFVETSIRIRLYGVAMVDFVYIW